MRNAIVAFVAVAAIAGSLLAAAFSSAAGTRVASQVVKTWNCTTDPQPVEEAVRIAESQVKVSISTGSASSPETWLSFRRNEKGYDVGSRCRPVSKHVVMSLNDLTQSYASHAACAAPGHVWVKLVMDRSSSNGLPLGAKIEITQPHAKLKPLGQVVWSSDGYKMYIRRGACTTQ